MTSLKSKLFLSIAALIVAGASAASAQVGFGGALKFEVAESFVVRDVTFPAGRYTITRTPSLADSSSLMIMRGENGKSIVFDTYSAGSALGVKNSYLVFDNINGTLFLTKLYSGEGSGSALAVVKAPVSEVVVSTSGLSL